MCPPYARCSSEQLRWCLRETIVLCFGRALAATPFISWACIPIIVPVCADTAVYYLCCTLQQASQAPAVRCVTVSKAIDVHTDCNVHLAAERCVSSGLRCPGKCGCCAVPSLHGMRGGCVWIELKAAICNMRSEAYNSNVRQAAPGVAGFKPITKHSTVCPQHQ